MGKPGFVRAQEGRRPEAKEQSAVHKFEVTLRQIRLQRTNGRSSEPARVRLHFANEFYPLPTRHFLAVWYGWRKV